MRRALLVLVFLLAACASPAPERMPNVAPGACEFVGTVAGVNLYAGDCVAAGDVATATSEPATDTPTAEPSPTETATAEPTATDTQAPPTATMTPQAPFVGAPLCMDSGEFHNYSVPHTLWDAGRGCHYDHEHGQDPRTDAVAAVFPDFDVMGLTIGHGNPSSPLENTAKHGGFKWDVILSHSDGCAGREGVPTGVDAMAIQYHAFGNYQVEFEARIHSLQGLLRQCRVAAPDDYGYVFVTQHADYGQRVSPYQGAVLPYTESAGCVGSCQANPLQAYDQEREPYNAIRCHGGNMLPCNRQASIAVIRQGNHDANTTWISEPVNLTGSGSPLFGILFRARDTYQSRLATDTAYPFTFQWICSTDGGATYNPAMPGCRWNNTTTRVHEVMGEIPAGWDGLAGFDSDPRPGRITAEWYVSAFGELMPPGVCAQMAVECFPIKLVGAFVGKYGSGFDLSAGANVDSFAPANLPERDICFMGGAVVNCETPGAAPSGWVGPGN